MFSLLTIAITTTDAQAIGENPFLQEWETALMDRFYSQISEAGMAYFSSYGRSIDFCYRQGVECTFRSVIKITITDKHYGNFDIHVLPPTVTHVSIRYCEQHYEIHTRALPRMLRHCRLNNNQLFGCVDLQVLPENIVILDLSHNQLNGPIDLTRLPQSMAGLWLQENAIRQSVVLYDRIPPALTSIILVLPKNPKNRIGKLRALYPGNPVTACQIFQTFPSKNIR
ncbi:hypothetical protein XU18_3398 [Perkinsela sp. CCAP 1560/4]|nr:hypothetical protein XU18_3398 [Perkinsela sp. CCAP 1560/4]|eukprot:KNH05627.1 hypothetical protein XU18_3398 [Perkinsela sp. CCAP 1560/4]